MTKVTLEFNLPEEEPEHRLAINGFRWYMVCYDLDQFLRNKMKYESHEFTEGQYDVYEAIREKLHELKEENHVSFDEIP